MSEPAAAPERSIALPIEQAFRIAQEYQQAERLDEAETLLARILAVAPREPEALHLMGLVAFGRGRPAEAAALVEQAIGCGAAPSLYYRNLCTIYERLGRYDDSVAAGRRAVELYPYDPTSYHNLTVVHYRRLALQDSIDCARQAITLDPSLPGAHFGLAEALLLRGDLAAGWQEYEWRFRLPGAATMLPKTDRPQWDGTPMPDATLLLVADQGYGDAIQFCRYILWAAQRCPHLALACSPELAPPLRQLHPDVMLRTVWEELPPFAAYCPLSGLPLRHSTTLATIPAAVPYLHAEAERATLWAARLDAVLPPGYRRVGIAWAGRPTRKNDSNRSTGLATFAPIAAVPGVVLVSLQKGLPQAEIGRYYGRAPLLNLGNETASFADTAAVIANLDLIVSVDTGVAHLAAAMAKPVWIMLPYAPDWRWLLDRTDSPWYPTVRLFRQLAPQRWDEVATAIAGALQTPARDVAIALSA